MLKSFLKDAKFKLKISSLRLILIYKHCVHWWVRTLVYSFVQSVNCSAWLLFVYLGFLIQGRRHEFMPFLMNRGAQLEREMQEEFEREKQNLEALKENNDRLKWFANQMKAIAEAPSEEERDRLFKAFKAVADTWMVDDAKIKHRHVCPKCGGWHEQEFIIPTEKGAHEIQLRCLNRPEQTYHARITV